MPDLDAALEWAGKATAAYDAAIDRASNGAERAFLIRQRDALA